MRAYLNGAVPFLARSYKSSSSSLSFVRSMTKGGPRVVMSSCFSFFSILALTCAFSFCGVMTFAAASVAFFLAVAPEEDGAPKPKAGVAGAAGFSAAAAPSDLLTKLLADLDHR